MPTKQFEIKPDFLASIIPYYLHWVWRFSLAALLAYGIVRLLDELSILVVSETALRIALVIIVLLGSFVSSKHRMIKLHQTKYLFYDTHVVIQTKMLNVKKQSMPYYQISKVTNNSNLLQRITRVSDIILHRISGSDFVLKSVKHPDDIEHKIYKFLKKAQNLKADDTNSVDSQAPPE